MTDQEAATVAIVVAKQALDQGVGVMRDLSVKYCDFLLDLVRTSRVEMTAEQAITALRSQLVDTSLPSVGLE